jgi:acyl carrier protein
MTATPDLEELRRIIADTLDVDVEEVTDDALFIETLGVDSLMALEVMIVLEKQYSVKISEERLPDIVCLTAARDLLVELLGAAA